ncbi:MAG: carboxypeptidase-like regulatory domain-containing protein [Pseudobacter sp.]|uniref:carboxypeptidase-like regulatory domain-containing protein n=1 Tax=Pseudobacter sp. TaxID=2045420 RepID=UPI003F7E3E2C
MKRHLLILLVVSIIAPFAAKAQFEKLKDSVVQLYGIVMTADSLKGIPSVSIVVKGQNRGTVSNDQGVFSIVVMKGDQIEFSSIGYKAKLVDIPRNIEGNQYSMIQLLVIDADYLPVTIIKPRPTKEQFERDFVNIDIPADAYEIARQNNDETKRRILAKALPSDGREATNMTLRNNASRYYYYGQAPPQNIFNPFAWSEFVNAWKRGDFKNK